MQICWDTATAVDYILFLGDLMKVKECQHVWSFFYLKLFDGIKWY
jgi:hypothetical protein